MTLTLAQMAEAAKKRVSLISKEFTEGFEFIKNYPRSVTIFGSTRFKEGETNYEKAKHLSSRIVQELRYSVLTGGGPGIMEAANRGAFEAGGNSIGLNIDLPKEQITNQYLTAHMNFHYFFTRKVCLSFSAEAYIFFPGGFGTLDEFIEILTLVQTDKIPRSPIILVGEEYWRPLETYFKKVLIEAETIDRTDLSLFTITDNEDEILNIVKEAPVRIGLEYKEDIRKNQTEKSLTEGPLSYLAEKHCLPCEGGVLPLSRDESSKFLKEISNWTLRDYKEIEKIYQFKDFAEAMDFINAVADIAETEGHHPDLKLYDYKKVGVRISTHAIGGLSENDFILAAKIDELVRK